MIVAIDAGNSRIKWGLHDGHAWAARGVLATADVTWLKEAAEDWPADALVVVCNVAGGAVGRAIDALLASLRRTAVHFHASSECCDVQNGYASPSQLGADRWAALVGARGLCREDCIVVCAGTATTIDRLDADGRFVGGVILPGFDLMRSALAGNTAQLPLAEGELREMPTNTMDAIVSGCFNAQLGAIERMFSPLSDLAGACCLITGGAAPRLLPHLRVPVRHEENLILSGLVRYANSLVANGGECLPPES